MKFPLKTPCVECPFLKSVELGLRPGRKKEIATSLREDMVFPCHMSERVVHCAGALIVMENTLEVWDNWILRMARSKFYDPKELNLDAPVFDTLDDFARDRL